MCSAIRLEILRLVILIPSCYVPKMSLFLNNGYQSTNISNNVQLQKIGHHSDTSVSTNTERA